uniref:Toxin 37 isoform n=1 Tax=Cupiennius salei TaxID=6928 RepID=A0A4Y5UHB9_CUPSA|nr:toxin 37 isoform precursor [Cupiennius salei]
MKTALIFLCFLAVVYSAETESKDTSVREELAPKEEERACVPLGEECNGNDCKCCNKWTYCKCPFGTGFACSCVFGGAMVCERKKKKCKNPEVMNTPPGPCFSGRG